MKNHITASELLTMAEKHNDEKLNKAVVDYYKLRNEREKRTDENSFARGYVCALATMIKSHGIDTAIVEAWRANQYTWNQMVNMGVDAHDLDIFAKHWKELGIKNK